MEPIFRVRVNLTKDFPITTSGDADWLCDRLARRPVFVVAASREPTSDPSLSVIVESGRAHVSYLNMGEGVKLESRDGTCTRRGFISLNNDDYPELELDQVEVSYRSIISPDRALSILRHFLRTGQPIDMVLWPSADDDEWS
jgi:hypothetical protein